ncbi:cytidine deaminase-like protein [Phyllosticta capitalensis]|uniref:Cytidine deaminase n=1 Tax=Phyllosticta capitalensis TaxID=121624 RepID=A0ABR1YZI4_9PEZI
MPVEELSLDQYGITAQELTALSEKCLEARERAYCPYSQFRVGAALLLRPRADSTSSALNIVIGANVENASYPVGTCAERVAVGTAVVQGYKHGDIRAVGVATDIEGYCSPCGMCRQFLREFLDLDTPIFMHNKDGNFQVKTMGELLPMSFGPDVLPPPEELLASRASKAPGSA